MKKEEFEKVVLEFKEFYSGLKDNNKLFYIFFTTDLLFWVKKALSFVPDDINIIVICAGLTKDELIWVNKYIIRPKFVIEQHCDDRDIWDMLFQVNEKSFGWMDIDCFVLNKDIFYEIAEIDNQTAINCIWTCKSDNFPDIEFVNTHFLFLNISTIETLKQAGIEVSPRTYVYDLSDMVPFTRSDIILPKHLEIIGKKVSEKIYPDTVENFHFFDTLQLYQIVVESLGFRINKVRNLCTEHYFTDEVIHIGAASNYSEPNMEKFPEFKKWDNLNRYLTVSYTILKQYVEDLPIKYRIKEKMVAIHMQRLGINPDIVKSSIFRSLCDLGISSQSIEKILSEEEGDRE